MDWRKITIWAVIGAFLNLAAAVTASGMVMWPHDTENGAAAHTQCDIVHADKAEVAPSSSDQEHRCDVTVCADGCGLCVHGVSAVAAAPAAYAGLRYTSFIPQRSVRLLSRTPDPAYKPPRALLG